MADNSIFSAKIDVVSSILGIAAHSNQLTFYVSIQNVEVASENRFNGRR